MILIPFISKPFKGTIWRIEVDSLSNTVFLEIRDNENKNVSFSSVDLLTGKTNFENFTLPERWLSGIEVGYDGMLLLHNYQSPTSPVHKAVIAINNKGDIAWSNYTWAFDQLAVNGPVLFNTQLQPKKLFLTDIKTGTTIRPYEPLIDIEPPNYILSPDIVAPSHLNITPPVEPYGNIMHYLEYNNLRIVSLHSFLNGQLKQHLYIMDGEQVVFEDLLNADIQKLQPEAFILYKNKLIYIKNKSELQVLNL